MAPRITSVFTVSLLLILFFFFFQAEDGIRDLTVTGVQTCALPISDFSEAAASSQIYFMKTHEMPKEDFPAIYLVRDGRDVMISYAHYVLDWIHFIPIENQPYCFEDTLRNVIVNPNWGGWNAHTLAWTQRSTPTAVIRYE